MPYPDVLLYRWIGMSTQICNLIFFSRKFVKRPYIELCSTFWANLDTLNSKNLTNIVRNHSGCPSVLLKYTQYKCTGKTQKTSRYDTGALEFRNSLLIDFSWVNKNKILNFHVLFVLFFIWGGWHSGIAHNTQNWKVLSSKPSDGLDQKEFWEPTSFWSSK